MLELQIAFQTVAIIVLALLAAYLGSSVQSLRREVRNLKRGTQSAAPQRSVPAPKAAYERPAQPQGGQSTPPAPTMPDQRRGAPVARATLEERARSAALQTPPPRPFAQELPATPPPSPLRDTTAQRGTSLENVLGSRVLGILAALLVFAGLVFLAILVVPALTDAVRCAAMFVISGALTVAGVIATERNKTPFSQALLGCGAGSVFASLLIAYVYFNFLQDLPALILMLCWLGACMVLAHRHRSAMLAVIAQMGMAASVCFACLSGTGDGELPLVVGYQLMASAIVVVGCIRTLGRGRLAGAFVSMVVSLGVSNFVASAYASSAGGMGDALFQGTMAAQFAGVWALLLLVSVACGGQGKRRAKEQAAQDASAPAPGKFAAHVAAESLWFVALELDVVTTVLMVYGKPYPIAGVPLASAAALVCVFLHWATSAVLQRLRILDGRLAFVSVYLCATACTLLFGWRLVASEHPGAMPLEALVAAGLWATGAIVGEQRHKTNSVVFLGVDALLMAVGGYDVLSSRTNLPLAPAYVLVLAALLFAWWRLLPAPRREGARGPVLVTGACGMELSFLCAWTSMGLPLAVWHVAGFVCVLALVAVLAFAEPAHRLGLGRKVESALAINEFVCVALACLSVVSAGPAYYANMMPAASALAVGVSLVCAGVIGYRLVDLCLHAKGAPAWRQVLAGMALSLWAGCAAQGLVPADLGAVVTVCVMLSALACIALGFLRSLGALRLYGLIVALLCVLKIVTVDSSGADPVGRVIAFIVGGVICFAISALYTMAVRRLDSQTGKGMH